MSYYSQEQVTAVFTDSLTRPMSLPESLVYTGSLHLGWYLAVHHVEAERTSFWVDTLNF
jgi:hypothetical protein